jgi:hypothetical protein
MKRILLVALVAACSMEAPPAGKPPVTAAVAPQEGSAVAVAVPAPPSPGCYSPPQPPDAAIEWRGWPGRFVGADAPVDCSPGLDQAAVYCAHVHDACCTTGGWTCNNARYVDWYAKQCGR